jgi:hypothetical protein
MNRLRHVRMKIEATEPKNESNFARKRFANNILGMESFDIKTLTNQADSLQKLCISLEMKL